MRWKWLWCHATEICCKDDRVPCRREGPLLDTLTLKQFRTEELSEPLPSLHSAKHTALPWWLPLCRLKRSYAWDSRSFVPAPLRDWNERHLELEVSVHNGKHLELEVSNPLNPGRLSCVRAHWGSLFCFLFPFNLVPVPAVAAVQWSSINVTTIYMLDKSFLDVHENLDWGPLKPSSLPQWRLSDTRTIFGRFNCNKPVFRRRSGNIRT